MGAEGIGRLNQEIFGLHVSPARNQLALTCNCPSDGHVTSKSLD